MPAFIEKVVRELIQKQTNFLRTTIVLPGKRPMLFFRKSFQELGESQILPQFETIEDLVERISGLKKIEGISLWFRAYKAYKKVTDEPEDFESFIKWIPTILRDFNDIDASLVNSNQIFDYLISADRIKKWGEELEIGSNELMWQHLNFWKIIADLYHQLREDLLQNNLCYTGLMYRIGVEKLQDFLRKSETQFVFVGFNALLNAENKIVQEMISQKKASVFWDSDVYYLENKAQEAGVFLRKQKENFPDWNWTFDEISKPKKIEIISVGTPVEQAKKTSQILKEIPLDEFSETALILPDASLLPAVMNSIPEELTSVNITMGVQLGKVPTSRIFKSIFELQMNREKLGGGKVYYYKNIIEILDNPAIASNDESLSNLSEIIKKQNRIFSTPEFILGKLQNSSYSALFKIPETIPSFLQDIISWIDGLMSNSDESKSLEKEYFYRLRQVFSQLYEELKEQNFVENFKTLYTLYFKLLQEERIFFAGEPLEGLQVVGLLETRLLDFKNIIMISVNEGIVPIGRQENSFIPYDIRVQFGLHTYSESDAIYAYHFYRLLQRTKSAYYIYYAETEGVGSGEKSRYLEQMTLELPYFVEEKFATSSFTSQQKELTTISKTPSVLEKLEEWTQKGISASALNSYLRNPIDFYKRVILRIQDWDEVEESVDARILGNIVHNAVHELYTPLVGKILKSKDLEELNSKVKSAVNEAFKLNFGEGEFDKGKNLLVYEIAVRFIENIIKNDAKTSDNHEFIIHQLEEKFEAEFKLSSGKSVKLKGFIDRIDEVDEIIRVIDYKTGTVEEATLNLKEEKLQDVFQDSKYDKSLQLIFYAYLYFSKFENREIQLGIYPLKHPKKGLVTFKFSGAEVFDENLLDCTNEFLSSLILEILNPEIDFVEKEVLRW